MRIIGGNEKEMNPRIPDSAVSEILAKPSASGGKTVVARAR